MPSNYTAGSVAELIADITAANKHGGSNTIALAANTTFALTKVNNSADGATGLPVIKGGNNLTILGNDDIIQPSTASGTPVFRLFDVAVGGSLTLVNLTLKKGVAFGRGASAAGGAIYNQGSLVLDGVDLRDSSAVGSNGVSRSNPGDGETAAGGGIWSKGSLTLLHNTRIENNRARGGSGGIVVDKYGDTMGGGLSGHGLGGGIYIAAGTADLDDSTLSSNEASGGGFGLSSSSAGGGLYIASGTVKLHGVTVYANTASSQFGGGGNGGGLYVAGGAVNLDAVMVLSNTAGGDGYGAGGGVAVSGGTVKMTNSTLSGGNMALAGIAQPGQGGGLAVFGGAVTLGGVTVESNLAIGDGDTRSAYGGGLYVAGGTLSLSGVTVDHNTAQGRSYTSSPRSQGGGLYIEPAATVYLDATTIITANDADIDPDIYGSYTLAF